MGYTKYMEGSIFEIWGDDSEDITADILGFLNSEDTFRDFGDGLRVIIENKYKDSSVNFSAKEYLKKINKEKGSLLNRNTIENWFEGNRPKKGEQSREHMYILSFLLELDIDETCYLFQKVYYDKPFNLRSIREFIYYYCIKENKSYEYAQELVGKVLIDETTQPEGTLYTQAIQKEVEQIIEEKQIIDYIKSHPHNFQISSKSAQNVVNKLISEILPTEKDRIDLRNKNVGKNASILAQEVFLSYTSADLEKEDGLLDKNKSITSISTMVDIILGINMVKTQQESTKSIFKNANLPHEIMNRFPTKHSFSKENTSFEELRKVIILLFSYKFWFKKQTDDLESDISDYQEQLDALLFDANLQQLYYGNPFDWLFLYCSTVERPLDLFRDIMAEALLFSDVNESYK